MMTSSWKFDFAAWFFGYLILFLIVVILNIIAWIYTINLRGNLGWLSFLTWLLSLLLAVKFIFSWHDRSPEGLFIAFILFSLITCAITFAFKFMEPRPFMRPLLITTSISCFLFLTSFLVFIEHNATLYMVYHMKADGRFSYPPYSIFKKEVDWETFFKSHNDRIWIREALFCYFTDPYPGDEFRQSLFTEWSNFNSSHTDKIDFSAAGIMENKFMSHFVIQTVSNSDLLTWWIKETKNDPRQNTNLKAFLEQLILILNQEEIKEKQDMINSLQELLIANRVSVKGLNDTELYKIYLRLAILNQSLASK